MKRTFIFSLIAITGLLMSFQLISSESKLSMDHEVTNGIHFQSAKWEEVKALAKKENKIIFVDIYASWCGPCKRLKATTFADQEVGSFYNKHFVNVAFDGEKGEGIELATKYKVTAYPTLLFVKPDGSIVKRSMGYYGSKDFISLGQEVIK